MMDLADGTFDLVLRTGGLETVPGHHRQLLARFSWLVCGSPDYLGRRGAPKTPLDLRAHDVIAFRNQHTGLVDAWRFTDRENGITRWQPDPAVVLDDANAIAAAAVAGVGLMWTPSWLVREAISSRSLVPALSDWSCEPMDISIVRRPQEQNPERIRKVIAFLIAHAQVFA